MILKNKKGDVPVTILVMMVVAICILTVLSFTYFRLSSKNTFLGVGLVETVKSIAIENSFYEKSGFTATERDLFEKRNVKVIRMGNTLTGTYTEKGTSFFSPNKEEVIVSVTYTSP